MKITRPVPIPILYRYRADISGIGIGLVLRTRDDLRWRVMTQREALSGNILKFAAMMIRRQFVQLVKTNYLEEVVFEKHIIQRTFINTWSNAIKTNLKN